MMIELLYRIAVILWVITGTIMGMVLWFLHRHDVRRVFRNVVCDVLMGVDRVEDWVLDKLFGCKGGVDDKSKGN